jgi:hypothetical protein
MTNTLTQSAISHFSIVGATATRESTPRNRSRAQGWIIALSATGALWAGIIGGGIALAHLLH